MCARKCASVSVGGGIRACLEAREPACGHEQLPVRRQGREGGDAHVWRQRELQLLRRHEGAHVPHDERPRRVDRAELRGAAGGLDVDDRCDVAWHRADECLGEGVPRVERVVEARREEQLVLGHEGEARHAPLVPKEGVHLARRALAVLSLRDVPQPDGAVERGGGEQLGLLVDVARLGEEYHARHRLRVRVQRDDALKARHVPSQQAAVVAAREEQRRLPAPPQRLLTRR
jgi:hypothetical protein